MSILVTGAAGFIGSHLTDRLLQHGVSVVGLDSFDDFYDPAIKRDNLTAARDHDGFTLIEGDIRDGDLLSEIPHHIEGVVHLAARAGVRPSIEQPLLYTDVNVGGTAQLLEIARRRSLGWFVFASSSSVYGNSDRIPFVEDDPVDRPISPYAATKKAGELICHAAAHLTQMTCLCLRFFTVYGPRQRPDLAIRKFARLMMDDEEIPMFGDGSSSRDYTYIDDIIDGVMASITYARENRHVYEIINLGESKSIVLRDMIRTVADALGVDPSIRTLPMQPGDVRATHADVSRARSLLGYDPTTDFEVGVRRFTDWYRSWRTRL